MITIQLNGEERQLHEKMTIENLLDHLDLKQEGIAVAVNHRVIPRGEHPSLSNP